jgi:tetratricopeptide (TPR) repeat protein/TolB-like protein
MTERRVLESWKAIASHVGHTERTCRRWEVELGLPVHRLYDSPKAHVFAYADELDRWKEEKLRAEKNHTARSRSRFFRIAGSWPVFGSAAILLVIAIAGVILWKTLTLLRAPAAPKIENSIAVITFKNQTGDPAYDNLQEVIPNLIITDLENTGLFYVATWERMRDVLKQMGVKPGQPIDTDLGFKVCRREGIKAIAIGSFAKAGDVFSTDVKVLDAETKGLLASASVKGTGVDSILDTQVDYLSRKMSLGWGVEKAKVDAAPMRIKDIATPSLQAYEYFLKGKEAYSGMLFGDLKNEMEKVLEIDPSFAMAYVYLAYADYFLGDRRALNVTLEKAMALSDRTSEKDRLYLEAAYAYFIKGDRREHEALLKELIKKYPQEKFAYHYLGDFYYSLRNYVGACDQFKRWLELDPQDTFAINHLLMATIPQRDFEKAQEYVKMREAAGPPDADSLHWQALMYRKMGQLDKAISLNHRALEIKPGFKQSIENLVGLYALKEEYDESIRWANEAVSQASSVGNKSGAYATRGFYRYWRGEFKEALDDFSRAEKMAEEVENWPERAKAAQRKGIAWVALGEAEPSRESFDDAIRIAGEHVPADIPAHKAQAALWMGYLAIKQGRIDQAQALLSELESSLTKLDQRTQKELGLWRDLLQGEVLLAQGSLDEALAISQKACQRGSPFLDDSTYFRDLLARVYAQKGEVDRAILEYERLLIPDVPAEVPTSEYERPERPYGAADVLYLIHPLYHYRLGLLYEKAGEVAKARAQYKKFLDLWKHADPGRPEIEDARERLTALQGRQVSAP